MVGLPTLDRPIGVRIPAPQPDEATAPLVVALFMPISPPASYKPLIKSTSIDQLDVIDDEAIGEQKGGERQQQRTKDSD